MFIAYEQFPMDMIRPIFSSEGIFGTQLGILI